MTHTASLQETAAAVQLWLQAHGRKPGMGSDALGGLWVDSDHRGDITSWVSLSELTAAGQHLLAAVVGLLQSLREQLAQHG